MAGDPADFGAPEPDEDVRVAGISLCQDYLDQVRDGSIACRPAIASVEGSNVIFTDGSTEAVEVIICATGYDIDIPYLTTPVWDVLGSDLALYQRTFHPDLPGLGVIGQFLAQGPYFPLLELQARWIAAVWSGEAALPDAHAMWRVIAQPRPPLDAHNALALTLSEELRVGSRADRLAGPVRAPGLRTDAAAPLPALGPGATDEAEDLFAQQLAASPGHRSIPLTSTPSAGSDCAPRRPRLDSGSSGDAETHAAAIPRRAAPSDARLTSASSWRT